MLVARKTITAFVSLFVAYGVAFGGLKEDAKAIDVSGGEDHTLILTANNWVWASGPNGDYPYNNYYGVLGTDSNSFSLDLNSLARVHDGGMGTESGRLEGINDVAAGWRHSLALDVNGFVWSWGWNSEGQLGDGTDLEKHSPVQVLSGEQDPNSQTSLLRYIELISAGRSGQHSLAVDANGYGYGWGYNEYGQCGNDANACDELTPVHVRQGQQLDDPNDPNDWLKHVIDICAGADQSIALEKDDPGDPNFNGCVYTWGTNWWGDEDYEWIEPGYGLLGTASMADFSDTPVRVHSGQQHPNDPNQAYLNHIVGVAAGWDHCMALEKDDPYHPNIYNPAYTGRVFTWGNNGPGWGGGTPVGWERSVGGRLGNGTYTDSNVPVLVLAGEQYPPDPNSPLKHITAVSAGEGHSMALDANGYVYTWGDNQYGQLGNGRNEPCSAPVRVIAGMQNSEDPNSPLSNIVAISAGHWHSLAIDSNGVVWVWGKTKDGRLGLADMAYANPYVCAVPHRIPVVYDYNDGGVGKGFAFSIEDAVNDANEADILEASWGIYYENVTFGDERITLKSEHPEDPEVVADTIIDAVYNSGSDYYFYQAVDFNDGSGSTLAGLTLMNAPGGGVLCEDVDFVSIMNCSILNNACDGIYLDGSSVNVTGCEIRANASNETYDYHGVYCESGSDVNIVNCTIADNAGNGITCEESSAAIIASKIQDNTDYGVEATGDCNVTIERSLIEGNGKSGVYAHDGGDFVLNGSVVRKNGWEGVDLESNDSAMLTNNWIHNNGIAHYSEGWGSGIWFEDQPYVAIVRNNTIYDNWTYGIEASESGADPNIINCIISGNDSNDLYEENGDFETVNYCCLQNARAGGLGNKTGDPGFMNIATDANDLHLDESSQCKDAGDPNGSYSGESDIDGEQRVVNGRVDMGADEFYWSQADFNGDGIVNFLDYAMLAWHWHETDANGGYDDVFDLADNNAIGFGDILAFCDEWLWQAGWVTGPMPLMGGLGGAGMVEGLGLDAGLSAVASAEREPAIAEPVDIEAVMKWLAEIWLDPDVQKSIDEERFLKVYESLKELESSRDSFW